MRPASRSVLWVSEDGAQPVGTGYEPRPALRYGRLPAGLIGFMELSVPVGGGPPMHVHPVTDEVFQLLDGELEMIEQNRVFRVTAGDVVFIPRGVAHAYRAVGDELSRILLLLSPTGFVDLFESGVVNGTGLRPII